MFECYTKVSFVLRSSAGLALLIRVLLLWAFFLESWEVVEHNDSCDKNVESLLGLGNDALLVKACIALKQQIISTYWLYDARHVKIKY